MFEAPHFRDTTHCRGRVKASYSRGGGRPCSWIVLASLDLSDPPNWRQWPCWTWFPQGLWAEVSCCVLPLVVRPLKTIILSYSTLCSQSPGWGLPYTTCQWVLMRIEFSKDLQPWGEGILLGNHCGLPWGAGTWRWNSRATTIRVSVSWEPLCASLWGRPITCITLYPHFTYGETEAFEKLITTQNLVEAKKCMAFSLWPSLLH